MGASIRVWDLGQTIFLHFYGSFTWVNLGGVGPFTEVKDAILHYGPMIELGIGRRLSLFGSILRRNHNFKGSADASGSEGAAESPLERGDPLLWAVAPPHRSRTRPPSSG